MKQQTSFFDLCVHRNMTQSGGPGSMRWGDLKIANHYNFGHV